ATEETIIARVGEGIVSAIGSAHSYKEVLENPDRISKTVLAKGLDSNTAFEILSIDIADVDVGDNIGAKLQTEQAEADKRVPQAKAEVRRAAAVAVEQEMRARTQEMRAKVVEAEALVPQAMADAFRSGNLGVMDYVRMKNVQADTSMRESIAGGDKPPTDGPVFLSRNGGLQSAVNSALTIQRFNEAIAMIAAHFENLLFLLLLGLAGLFQLLGRAARKTREDEENPTPKPAPGTLKPIPRAPTESDEERIRKF